MLLSLSCQQLQALSDLVLRAETLAVTRTLSTEQNMHHQEKDTPLPYPRGPINAPVQCRSLRPHHAAAQSKQVQCNPHHHGPGLFQSHCLSSLPHNDNQRGSSPVIPQTPVPMVWSPFKSNIQLRPLVHIPLCTSTNHEAKHRVEYQHSLSPTD